MSANIATPDSPASAGSSPSPLFGLALDACEQVMDAIAGHTDWHPDPHVDTPDWNEDAHIEVTLTVRDCRMLKRVLSEAGRWTPYA